MKKIYYFLVIYILAPISYVLAEEEKTSPFATKTLKDKAAVKLNPARITDLSDLMGRGINAMLMFMGSIALILVVYAGFMWMTAGGNESRIQKARTILVWTLLGTVAIGASYGFIKFVITIFG